MNVKIYNVNKDFAEAEAKKGNYYDSTTLNSLDKHGLTCSRCNYDLVWEHTYDKQITPDKLYSYLNSECPHPKDFHGHDLSMGDVVVIDNKAFYRDYKCWKELPEHWNDGLSSHIQDKCNLAQCKDACVYGCKAECAGRKIVNNGEGITAMLDKGKIVIYYNDILNCMKWKI